MRLTRLEVHDFGPVRHAAVDLGPGLNVLYGRNDLGKSYLAHAIRAALLLPHTSTAHEEFIAWGTDATPRVILTFQTADEVYWRVSKAFGKTAGAASTLERSPNAEQWSLEAKGRDVDGKLRRLLEWGIPEPGGKGKRLPRGLPRSFLTQVLLAEQGSTLDVFGDSLQGDPDESGKQLLGHALQALAQDPMFKTVLERTQKKVDEAFLPSGARRRGRNDPFPKATLAIRQALQEHDLRKHQREETERVREQLGDVSQERLRAQAVLDDAEITRSAFEEAWQAQSSLRKISAELAEAEAQIMKVTAAETEANGFAAAVADQERQLSQANETLEHAGQAAEAARERQRQAESEDGAQRLELERERLEKRRLELQAAEQKARVRFETAQQAGARAKAVAELEPDIQKRQAALEAARTELTTLVEKKASLETDRKLLSGVGALLRWRRAVAELEEATTARDRAADLRQQAAELRAGADAMTGKLAERKLPDVNGLEALKGLAQELEVARARIGVGLSVHLRLTSIVDLEVTRDGGKPETTPAALGDHQITSEREVTLDLANLARIEIQAGAAEARRRAEELSQAWQEDVVPVFEAAGVAGIAELEEACRAAEGDRRRAGEQRAEAERRSAKAVELAELAGQLDARAEIAQEREAAIEGYNRTALEQAAELGGDAETQLEALDRANAQALEQANARREAKRTEIDRAEHDLRHLKQRLEDEQRQLEELASSLDEPWEAAFSAAEAKLEAIADDLRSVTARRDALETSHDTELAEIRTAVKTSAKQLEQARAAVHKGTHERDRIKGALETKRGQLEVLRENAEKVDMPGLRAAFGDAQAAAEIPGESGGTRGEPVTEERLAEARQAVRGAKAVLAEKSTDVDKLQGALEQVGGDVAVEREKTALEALLLAKERERELDLDYGAWRLLVDTLREAENEESTHLGRALVGPVSERFSELTEGRYGKIGLDPDLRTTGIEVAGDEREVGSLSEGLKEQLATIFRISVAQHLESMIVLDDHLTHTDPGRLGWFREVLRNSGEKIQILVFTCRPLDYLMEEELAREEVVWEGLGRLRGVALEKAVDRVGVLRGVDDLKTEKCGVSEISRRR